MARFKRCPEGSVRLQDVQPPTGNESKKQREAWKQVERAQAAKFNAAKYQAFRYAHRNRRWGNQ